MKCIRCGSSCFEELDDGGLICCQCGFYVKPHIVEILNRIKSGDRGENLPPDSKVRPLFACARTLR
ncbi:hypothetical protein [Archaeoglobus sp.]